MNNNPYNDPRIDAADPALKGIEGGNCNRTACQQPKAAWYNESTHAYYCRGCAIEIQRFENDNAFINKRVPMEIFNGIFNHNDPRHQIKYDN